MASPKSRRRGSNAGGSYGRLPTSVHGNNNPPIYPIRKIVWAIGFFAIITFLLFAFVIPPVSDDSKGNSDASSKQGVDEKPKAPVAAGKKDASKDKSKDVSVKAETNFHSPPPCKKPADPNRPLIQHAIMIDAGSTGSRIHVYRFHFCDGSQPTLLGEIFEQRKPGLSSFADKPEDAAKSLDPLLEQADKVIPEDARGCTPVAVKATAGLRLIGEAKSKDILDAVRSRLETNYAYKVIDGEDGVGVMDGRDEGVFAWITVNYLLKKITSTKREPTAAIMDLGGGSTQIVFEPLVKEPPLAEGDHRYELKFNGRNYILYQHSYLGYGLMEGRKSILKASVAKHAAKAKKQGKDKAGLPTNPCLPAGFKMNATVDSSVIDPEKGDELEVKTKLELVNVPVVGSGAGFAACSQHITNHLFDKDPGQCKVDPCSWDGVHQPLISHTFPEPHGDIYAFSYIYDRTIDLGFFVDEKENPKPFSVDGIRDLGDQLCGIGLDGKAHRSKGKSIEAKLRKAVETEPAVCMDLGFIYHLLSTGYEIRGSREIKTAKKIDGIETGWCLGAAIRVLDEMMGGAAGGLCKG
ncbi:Guanosine-diphosphatase [Phlyctochytrium planicorne]|nr:Guanosine-diphosphatase [Phlyctochytrium planicorne]